MDTQDPFQSEMTVEEVLKTWPGTHTVFMNGKAGCIGCFLQKFCTLQEVAAAYQVSLTDFFEELKKHIRTI